MSCPATSSGLKSADGAISTLPARLKALIVEADGTNKATAIVYDNPSAASGTVLAKLVVNAGDTSGAIVNLDVIANKGLYLDVDGDGAAAIVHFSAGA